MLQHERNRKPDKPDDFVFHELSDNETKMVKGKQLLRKSFNFVDYVRTREINIHKVQKINQENCSRHMLTHNLFKEYPITLTNMNTVYCSQWLSDRQVVFGTKCNKFMVYDVVTQKLDQISLLHGRQLSPAVNVMSDFSICFVEINPSRTLLSTRARNWSEIAIYKSPTLDPVCVGESGHTSQIFDMCWLDDEFLVSGSEDMKLALWHIDSDLAESPDKANVPTHKFVQPVLVKECNPAQAVLALAFNKTCKEIAVLTFNNYMYIWSAESFQQKRVRKLPFCDDVICFAVQDNGIYAIGCKCATYLLDPRTLQKIQTIPRCNEWDITSLSFQGSLLNIGTVGMLKFYDVKAQKYLKSSIYSKETVVLKASKGYVCYDERYLDHMDLLNYNPAIYTHCYDTSGIRLFMGGGPIQAHGKLDNSLLNYYGNYAGIWQ